MKWMPCHMDAKASLPVAWFFFFPLRTVYGMRALLGTSK